MDDHNTASDAISQWRPPRNRGRAILLAVLAMLGAGIPLALVVIIIGFVVWFNQGGTLGGFGAAASADYNPGRWVTPFGYGLTLLAIVIDAVIGVAVYRSQRKPKIIKSDQEGH